MQIKMQQANTAFNPSYGGLRFIDKEMVFSEYWVHPGNQINEWRHKSVMCTEVLVPGYVSTEYITGAYVSSKMAAQDLIKAGLQGNLQIDKHMFLL